jgi:hypothetical protein
VFHSQFSAYINRATLVYSEASSADAGISLKLGKESADDYFLSVTSEVSKDQWYEKDLTLSNRGIEAGDSLLFESAGSKTGTGAVYLIVEVEYHTR